MLASTRVYAPASCCIDPSNVCVANEYFVPNPGSPTVFCASTQFASVLI